MLKLLWFHAGTPGISDPVLLVKKEKKIPIF